MNLIAPNLKIFMDKASQASRQLKTSLDALKAECKTKEAELDAKLQETIGFESRLAENIRLKEERVKETEREIESISSQLESIDASLERLAELEQKIQCAEQDLQRTIEKVDENALKREIVNLQSEKISAGDKTAELQKEMFEAQRTAEIRSTLDNLNKEIEMKREQSDDLYEKHRSTLDKHFAAVEKCDLRERVEEFVRKTKSEFRSSDLKIREIHSEMNKNEEARSMNKKQLLKKESELKEYEEEILRVSTGSEENFEIALDRVQESLEKLRFEKGRIEGSQFMYKDYVKRLNKKSCCPLCKRNFSSDNEAKTLLNEINRTLTDLPEEKERLNDEISGNESKLKSLHQLQPTVELATKLKKVEIPALSKDSEKLIDRYKKLKSDEKLIDDKLSHLKNDLASMEDLLPDAVVVDNLEQEMDRLKIRAENLKTTLGNDFSNRPLDRIRDDYEHEMGQLRAITERLERKQEFFASHRERVQKLRERSNDLHREKLNVEERSRNVASLKDALAKARTRFDNDRCEIDRLRVDASPARRRAAKARDDLLVWRQDAERRLATETRRVESLASLFDESKALVRQIDDFEQRGIAREFEKSSELAREVDARLKSLADRHSALNDRWTEMTTELEMHETHRRNLSDNLEIMVKSAEIDKLDHEINRCMASVRRLEDSGSDMDATTLRNEYTKLNRKFSEAQGRLNEQKLNVDRLTDQLEQEKYKSADRLFGEKMVDLIVTQKAVEDLRKFEKAFEHCLMAYHREKMDEINVAIRRSWEKIYKGIDIDYIKIKAETAAESGSSDRRRAYNYRVVMVVNGTEMDMRGRCSAGQKMLASIIIRIALADVFCSQCGVLALDEPTTNLDSQNMQSLAEALGEVIDERSSQKIFS